MNNHSFKKLGKTHVIAGFGNPLLDISVRIKENAILRKYNLKPDGQKEVSKKEFCDLLKEINSEIDNEVTSTPGGCAQNTLRIIQFLVKSPSFCVFFGGLGDDQDGEFLESEAKKCGLDTRYTKHSEYPTGRVAALINDNNRSLVANLGAAEIYSVKDFMIPDHLEIMEEIFIVYIEGFFITHSFDVGVEVTKLSKTNRAIVAFNISGAYVAEGFSQALIETASAADIVIGNACEFKALARVMGLEPSSLEDVALKVHASLWERSSLTNLKLSQMNRFGKTVIVTQGKDPVLCVSGDKKLVQCVVPYLDNKLVKDPTGAGDAFAAGFLVALIKNKSLVECLDYGCAIAQLVIQHMGVQLSN